MSESEYIPGGKSEEELAVDAFVDSMMEIYPNLDREEFRETINGCVRDAVGTENGEEEGEEEE